ncbi:MAG TPA: alcohol dehydrogenase catalytic domain-containing protein, partial [Gaiellaceae bacterium]|nr:alcohol dehydrogenase catalytic domain-containing protein [Gaiellaceae bacterium]
MSPATVTRTRAAVFRAVGLPQEVAEVELGPLGPDHVVVEVRAVSICGTDLHMVNGDWVRPRPMVLGHECAGVVARVGSEVAGVAVGDHVAVCWSAPCGRCASCEQDAPQRCLPAR